MPGESFEGVEKSPFSSQLCEEEAVGLPLQHEGNEEDTCLLCLHVARCRLRLEEEQSCLSHFPHTFGPATFPLKDGL